MGGLWGGRGRRELRGRGVRNEYVPGCGGEPHYGQTDEGDEGVSNEDRAADVEVVAQVGGDDH